MGERHVRIEVADRAITALIALMLVGCGSASPDERSGLEADPRSEGNRCAARFEAAVAGELPANGSANIGGVELPAGERKLADPTLVAEGSNPAPVLWMTDEALPDPGPVWLALAEAFPETGLWPLFMEGEDHARRPWDTGEFGDPPAETQVDASAAEDFLRQAWRDSIPLGVDFEEFSFEFEPFGRRFPGLAPVARTCGSENLTRAVNSFGPRRLGLVPVRRPGDVLAHLGWSGVVNYTDDLTGVSAVLRSWEDRFGAVIASIGFDDLTVFVEGPVRDRADALEIAAEHYAFCNDEIVQGIGSIRDHADALLNAVTWTCWWD